MQKFYHKYLDYLLEVDRVSEMKEKRMGARAENSSCVPYKAIRWLRFLKSDLAYVGMSSQELGEEIDKLWSGNLLRVLDEVQEIAKKALL